MTIIEEWEGTLSLYAKVVFLNTEDIEGGKSETDTEREEEVTKCEMQAAIFFPLYWYCGSLIFHLHIFPSEMGYKFKSLITMLTQKSFESLSSVLTSLVSSLWKNPTLCRYFYLEILSPHPIYLQLGNSNRSSHKYSWFKSFFLSI